MHTTQATVARLIAIVLLAVMPLTAAAQDARGTISGTVVDASKSLVPGASVTATNIAMGTDVSAVTNADGFFQIPYLIPGAYKVTVELAGFKKWVRESVDVRVADRLELAGRARSWRHGRGSDRQRRDAAPRNRQRLARQRRRCPAHLRAADGARRSVQPDRPGRRRLLHRLGPPRSSLRADAHRRLRDGRHARQPQRPDHRRRAEHRHRERRRGHRVVRAAARHRPGVQGADGHLRRGDGQHRGRRDQPEHQGGQQLVLGHGLFREDAEGAVRQRLLRQRQQHSARRLHLQPLRRQRRRPHAAAGLRRPAADVLHVRLRRDPRGAAAQQRHADGADREDAHRRFLGAARARPAVPDLQPVHATGGRRAAASWRIRSPATSFRRA